MAGRQRLPARGAAHAATDVTRRARFGVAVLAGLLLGCAAPPLADARRSGFDEMGESTRALQRDDAANPAMLWVQGGQLAWARAPAASSRACASCHGDGTALAGVAARYPAWDEGLARPVTLRHRINLCRERHQGQAPWPAEAEDLIGLEAWLGLKSRGQPITPPTDPRLAPHRAAGEALFRARIGQLELSCAQCHDERAGGLLGGTRIPQGHVTGYPIYRLEWQGMGSLGRRLRNCMTGVRAEPLAHGSLEMTQLELYLATRAMGMAVETPAVRP